MSTVTIAEPVRKPRSAEMFPGPGLRVKAQFSRLNAVLWNSSRISTPRIFLICSIDYMQWIGRNKAMSATFSPTTAVPAGEVRTWEYLGMLGG